LLWSNRVNACLEKDEKERNSVREAYNTHEVKRPNEGNRRDEMMMRRTELTQDKKEERPRFTTLCEKSLDP
jgi:hypothetical protein